MKTNHKPNVFWMIVLLGGFLAFSGCDDDDDDDDDGTPNLVALQQVNLTGAQETPPVTTSATGTFSGTYNDDTNVLSYTITFQGLTPTAMHFHKGAVGVAGGVEIPIGTAPYTSPIQGQTPALTAAQEADLLNGLWYVNIHTTANPGGELRGQVLKQ
ncbi:CHRD domain-containing protein [Pontibacter sp. CAU 1760]